MALTRQNEKGATSIQLKLGLIFSQKQPQHTFQSRGLASKACECPKLTQINQGQLGGTFGVQSSCPGPNWGPLEGSEAKFRPFLGQILTLPDPHCTYSYPVSSAVNMNKCAIAKQYNSLQMLVINIYR